MISMHTAESGNTVLVKVDDKRGTNVRIVIFETKAGTHQADANNKGKLAYLGRWATRKEAVDNAKRLARRIH